MDNMIWLLATAVLMVSGAPPQQGPYAQQPPLQQIPLDYYVDNPEAANYYNQGQQQKQGNLNNGDGAPSRLETLDPDSEVELLPGAQQPQQPPQQVPVAPNIPGLLPGQRVFIIHTPVPGYRPGTIGGYQPVYIVAAAPQGNTGYNAMPNGAGFQNTVLLDPSGQAVYQPVFGYPRPGFGPQGHNPGLILGAAPLTLNRPYDLVYQDPAVVYQPGTPTQVSDGSNGNRGSVRLSQLLSLQGQPQPQASQSPRAVANESAVNNEPKRDSQESKESLEESRPNTQHKTRQQARNTV